MLTKKNIKNVQNNALYTTQELHLSSLLSKVFLTKLVSLIFPVHSSTNGSINFQQYSTILQDLLHSHSQLLGFQTYPLSNTPLSINSLHSHLHLSSLHLCLLLQ